VFGWGVDNLLQGARTNSLEGYEDSGPGVGEPDEGGDAQGVAPAPAPRKDPEHKPAPITTGKPKPVLEKGKKSLEDYF